MIKSNNIKVICIKGIYKGKTLLCLTNDELELEDITTGYQLLGIKGYCKNSSFTLSSKEISKNFISK